MVHCEHGKLRFPESSTVVIGDQKIPGEEAIDLLPICNAEGMIQCSYCYRFFCLAHAKEYMKDSGKVVCSECEYDYEADNGSGRIGNADA